MKLIIPFAVDEDKLPLGRGLRSLAGYYHAFDAASYFAKHLLDRLTVESEREHVDELACRVEFTSWCASGVSLLSFQDRTLNVKTKEGLSRLTDALTASEKECATVASVTMRLWNMFYRKKSTTLEGVYNAVCSYTHAIAKNNLERKAEKFAVLMTELEKALVDADSFPKNRDALKKKYGIYS